MHSRIFLAALGAFLVACGGADDPVAPSNLSATELGTGGGTTTAGTVVPIFTGRGTSIDATVGDVNTKFCDAGPMLKVPSGHFEDSAPSATIAGVLTAKDLECITAGAGTKSIAEASANDVRLTIAGNTITVARVHSMVNAACPPQGGPKSQGHTIVRDLVVNGKPVAVLNTANQRVNLPNGFIVISDQTSFVTQFHAGRTLKAIRVVIDKGETLADIALARTQGHIDCP